MKILISYLHLLFFPETCLGCGILGTSRLCEACGTSLRQVKQRHQLANFVCETSFVFSDDLVAALIKALKYDGCTHLAAVLADKVSRAMQGCVVMAVPMTKSSWKTRGYNHSELLARHLASKTSAKYLKMPISRKGSEHLAGTDKLLRQKLVNEQYQPMRRIPYIRPYQEIIVVDDVLTTGATLNRVISLLRQMYPLHPISALAITHQPLA